MNTLYANYIDRSIELMDEFVEGNYDYLELGQWYSVVRDSLKSLWDSDSENCYYIHLLITKEYDENRFVCQERPTMTQLRQSRGKILYLDRKYDGPSFDGIIWNACKMWKKDTIIPLPMQICLRAQTSENRTDYGCEWYGGGDWEPKTLYGDTTDFYISAIILKEYPSYSYVTQKHATSVEEEAHAKLDELTKHQEILSKNLNESIPLLLRGIQLVTHKTFGNGEITNHKGNRIKVHFLDTDKEMLFQFPDAFADSYLQIIESEPQALIMLEKTIAEWRDYKSNIKLIDKLKKALESDNMEQIVRALYSE